MSLTIKPSKTIHQTVHILCDCCRMTTVHLIIAAVDYTSKLPDDNFVEWGTAQVTKCQGCETIGFRQIYRTNEFPEEPEELLFPPRNGHKLAVHTYLRDDIWNIPNTVRSIYLETLIAIQHYLPTLAGIGIRAVIEVTCQQLKTKKHDLESKINELVNMSFLTPKGAEILHRIRLLGNDAAHNMKAPTMKQIISAIKVIDHLLMGVYVLPQEASVFPKRKAKAVIKNTKTDASTTKNDS
jgi:hypothetical protein